MRAVVTCLLLAASCSGGAKQIPIGPVPARQTSGALAGNLCTAEGCTCRDLSTPGAGGVGAPEPGKKRFELRFGPSPQALWVTMPGGTVLYKSAEKADACFYIDLSPGTHPLEMRASAPEGVSAAWSIHEFGPAAASWYDTFTFNCGSPGVCSFTDLDEAKAHYAGAKRGLYDKCGSTRVKGLTWDTGHAPDQLHPSELVVRLDLDVYKFPTSKSHGDETCAKPGAAGSAASVPDDSDGPPAP